MKKNNFVIILVGVLCCLCVAATIDRKPNVSREGTLIEPSISFKKTVLTDQFISEGVAVADVNNDGVTDIIAGAKWFQGPDWKKIHDIYPEERVFDGTKGYSNSMLNFTIDVDQDGWIDYIRVDFPGEHIWWYQNTGSRAGH